MKPNFTPVIKQMQFDLRTWKYVCVQNTILVLNFNALHEYMYIPYAFH